MRISIGKSKNKVFVYTIRSCRKNNKSSTEILKKLGSMDEFLPLHDFDHDKVLTWAKEQAKIAPNLYNAEQQPISISFSQQQFINLDEQRSFNCGYLFLQSLCSQLRLDNICRNIKSRHDFEYLIQSIFMDLIYSRILHPSSKKSSFDFAHTLLEQPKYELHHVYRALSVLAQESDYIQSEIYKNSNFTHSRNKKILYYDCTNYYFEIEDNDELRKYGKIKRTPTQSYCYYGTVYGYRRYPFGF